MPVYGFYPILFSFNQGVISFQLLHHIQQILIALYLMITHMAG